MKKFGMLFLVISLVFIGSFTFSNADDSAWEVGFYSISNKQVIAQDDGRVLISFDITNNTSNYYPELFIDRTLKVNGEGSFKNMYFPYYNYEPVEFSLEPKEEKTISLNCELPEKLPNKNLRLAVDIYSVTHKLSNESEVFDLNEIIPDFLGFLEGEEFSDWKLNSNKYIHSDIALNTNIKNLPQIYLELESTFRKEKKAYPQYIIYEKTRMYNKPIYSNIGDEIIFKKGEKKEIILDIPAFIKSNKYFLKLNFIDESGIPISCTYDYIYVIEGASATVAKITGEKMLDTNLVKAYIYGPDDQSELEDVNVEVLVYDLNNNLINQKQEKILLNSSEKVVMVDIGNITNSEINVIVNINYNGKRLDSKTQKIKLNISNERKLLFNDISGLNCEQAVKTLNGLGIISGYPDNTFRPNNLVTRAEFSTIVTKLLGLEINEEENIPFADANIHWAKNYINAIYKKGFVSGYPDGSFGPQNNVTYQEALTILLNALGYKNEVNNSEETWPYNYIEKSFEIGLNNKLTISNFSLPANRGDISLLALRAYLLNNK